ncbi:alginate lyase family protein [Paraburkholderia sp. J12]|uniref:alginate lyase family protein n=1 Tax=Paraburkholderia sp. J12 TaxID=2805432 RepID=UPI002ABD5998|nr:alginate lyase family protein [Paraburkholderia sp. J12]
MKTPAARSAVPRRRFLGALAASCALAAFVRPSPTRAQDEREDTTYVLSSPERREQIRRRVSAPLVAALREQADAGLARLPHPRAVVHTQGLLPHEQDRDASVQSQEDWRQTLLQAIAGCVTGKDNYTAKAVTYIEAWIPGYVSSSNPIDEADLVDLLLGFDFVKARLSEATIAHARALGSQMAQGYLGERRVGDPSTGLNNWQSHRVKLATAGAFLAGDAALIAASREAFMAHAMRNIDANGLTYDFDQRDAIHYVVYDLEPLLLAASMAAAHGENWYAAAPLQGRLAAALRWLEPYASGARPHEEFVHSTVGFDARRAAAHVEGYSGLWRREEARNVYGIAAHLDPQFTPIAAALEPQPVVRALFA